MGRGQGRFKKKQYTPTTNALVWGYKEWRKFLTQLNTSSTVLLLDRIMDPQNLGAVIRSSYFFGVDGVVIPKRRACPLTETVAKTSAGTLGKVDVVRVANLGVAVRELKKQGFWVVAAVPDGQEILWNVRLKRPLAIILGNEKTGISSLLKKLSDFLIRIPQERSFDSLNVSCAGAIFLYEICRQNNLDKGNISK